MNAWIVLFVGLGSALATGLGVLPVAAIKVDGKSAIGFSSSLAAGFMLGASAGLFYEGVSRSVAGTLLGALFGVLFIAATRAALGKNRDAHIGGIRGTQGMAAVLLIGVMTVHSLTEGAAIGVSFAGEDALGWVIAVAIAFHNIPEGVAISLALVPFGASLRSAAGWSVISSLPQPLVAVPAYLAVGIFEPLLPAGLGFAGGAMTWMVLTRLLPEAFRSWSRLRVSATVTVSMALMIVFEFAIGF